MRKISDDLKEIFEVVDKTGKVIGQAKREECHRDRSLIHKAIHLYIFNKDGKVFLQKRSQTKDVSPGCWTASASGHLMVVEDFEKAIKREAKEELGVVLKDKDLKWIGSFLIKGPQETELIGLYLAYHEGPFKTEINEIEKLDWFELEALFNKAKENKVKLTFNAHHFLTNKKIKKAMRDYVVKFKKKR